MMTSDGYYGFSMSTLLNQLISPMDIQVCVTINLFFIIQFLINHLSVLNINYLRLIVRQNVSLLAVSSPKYIPLNTQY